MASTCLTANAQQNNPLLPELGDNTSALASNDEVYELGQSWLRQFRARVPESQDALMYTYLDNLLENLSTSSALEDKRLELIVVKNPTLNAFAVPGGIVGVHNGIFSTLMTSSSGPVCWRTNWAIYPSVTGNAVWKSNKKTASRQWPGC
ncbi:MAG: hypothetical protein IPK95_12030 [Cellvibrionales bacterium]|nr:hypothetical protein [Cellvibrionales bacterium]